MTECFLAGEELHQLNRDLRILIATNGTLTRILGVVTGEEIVVQIVEQQIHDRGVAPSEQLSDSRILQRRVLLNGGVSGRRFVGAESLIAVDLLPPTIAADLTSTTAPIGEIMAASRLETFKEPADIWVAESPDWLTAVTGQVPQPWTVSRRYRIILEGQPVIVITEYFLDFDTAAS
ncbi:chorismate--pyruvate lyase family protein [Mycolicibacterium mucogenicum]|uniref:chorismate--pyruvate lyase family protein n=1 Tax=Mycolicibacterium mucogenicum TaxID=56689 RepID=UPI00076ABB52|nr:chorismate pyruvate-lyase family protein [Mycolicibacterium mucogenicum]